MSASTRGAKPSGTQIHTPAEAEIRAVFAHLNPGVPVRSLNQLAKLVATFANVVADLGVEEQKRIPTTKSVLREALLKATLPSLKLGEIERKRFAASGKVERNVGTGLGELLSLREGRDRIARYVRTPPLESWAGPVAGPGEIEKMLNVPRSTLNEWRRRGAVIGLLRGERKHVYPLDQFVDARPTRGIGDVAKVARDERAAWLWLRQPHGRFDMRSPLEVLKTGRKDEVLQAAERDFV
jgi:hypothetical protein